MSIARVTELSAISERGFKDAIDQAVARATKTLRGVEGCWVQRKLHPVKTGGNFVPRVLSRSHQSCLLRTNVQTVTHRTLAHLLKCRVCV
jgi:flavin-binding protein dodecin